MTARPGIQTDSERNPDGKTLDSALRVEKSTAQQESTSSLSAAQGGRRAEEASLTARIRAIPETDALTRLVATIRPAWDIPTIRRAIERDDRPWTVVVEAFWRGACDPDIAHPNGLRYVAASYDQAVPRLPSVSEALAANDDDNLDDHGFPPRRCPFCRHGIAPEEDA